MCKREIYREYRPLHLKMVSTGHEIDDENYMKLFLMNFVIPIMCGVLAALLLASFFICRKKVRKVNSILYAFTFASALTTVFVVITTPIYSPLHRAEIRVNTALAYVDQLAADIFNVKNNLTLDTLNASCYDLSGQSAALQTVCSESLAFIGQTANYIIQQINTTLNVLGVKIRDYISPDDRTKITDMEDMVMYFGRLLQTVTWSYVITMVGLYFMAQFISAQIKNDYSMLLHLLAIFLTIAGLCLSFLYLFLAMGVGDFCRDPEQVLDRFANDSDLTFYTNCIPRAGQMIYPPIMDPVTNFLANPNETTSLRDNIIDTEDQICSSLDVCCSCSVIVDGILKSLGDPRQITSTFQAFECTKPHNIIHQALNGICDLSAPLLTVFGAVLALTTHVLFMFFLVVDPVDRDANKKMQQKMTEMSTLIKTTGV